MNLIKTAVVSNGGSVSETGISFKVQTPQQVAWEQSFQGIRPAGKVVLKKHFADSLELKFDGNSIVVEGSVVKTGHSDDAYQAHIQAWLDGGLVEEFTMPYDYITRKYEIFSRYCFDSGNHSLILKLLNPHPDFEINAQEMVIYDKDE